MILDLSKSSREKFYSLVSITKFSDSYTRMKGKPNDFLLKTKMPYRKIDKKQLDRYIEDNLLKVAKVKENKIFGYISKPVNNCVYCTRICTVNVM